MTTESTPEDLSAIFDACLDELLSGSPVDDCLRRSRAHRQEIRPLLMAVHVARSASTVPDLAAERVIRRKAEFLAAAAGQAAGSGRSEPETP